jgi:BirA family transcriptional regulator, biotin operon repressor / biotin---[acetyl-CoA-carboxylase] ligase
MTDFQFHTKLIPLEIVDSTNNYAARLIKEEQPAEGTVILADFQETGRGQKDQVWVSEKGKNLTFSIILYPGFMEAEKHFYLSMALSVAMAQYLQTKLNDVYIKWPNDIYIGRKKIAGMLIENSLTGSFLKSSVLGVGLNVNQVSFPEMKPEPTSLALEMKKEQKREEVLNDLLQFINSWMVKLYSKMTDIKKTFESMLLYRNEPVEFMKGNSKFTGTILGVNELGQLKVKNEKDTVELFNFKEIGFPK